MRLWLSSLALAVLAAFTLFDARPGVNWPLWIIPAALGLYYFATTARADLRAPLALAALLSVGAAVTASGELAFLIVLSCTVLLAYAMRLAAGEPVARAGAGFIATAPLIGAFETLGESWRRATDARAQGPSERSIPVVRGLLIAAPVVFILWLLLAEADPHLSAWAEAIGRFLRDLTFIPRLIFGFAMGVLVLGAYGLATRGAARGPFTAGAAPGITVGATERLIVLGSVMLLFGVFVALQIPMFFGNPAAVAGSGITYAEWSRRGFAELATAAAIVTVLIVLLDSFAARGSEAQERAARGAALALVALTLLVLATAFRRVALYEAAYGYTVARVRGQAFMIGVAIVLALLAWEISAGLDPRRLARRAGAAAALTIAALAFWNAEAFIVRRNVARYAVSGKLDIWYLTNQLSPDAIPALFEARTALPPAVGDSLYACMYRRNVPSRPAIADEWYEFNVRRREATRLKGGWAPPAPTACPAYSD
jgi:hypothetical protein